MIMTGKLLRRLVVPLALSALVGACTQPNTADQQQASQGSTANVAVGLDRFLLFPNPIGQDPFAQDGGTFETNTNEYAAAYYRAIDPGNAKDTIDKWKTANLFGTTGNGTEHLAVFRDVKDLGYGRRMTGRMNADGSVAFYVENYNVTPGGSTQYSSDLNVDAAIRRDTQWHVGTNAIEWSAAPCIAGIDPPDCDPTVRFAKYYNFSPADGTRQLAVDLDGKGKKAMPGPCITCHGGRGDPLTPADVGTGNPRFPLAENSLSRKRGDVEARLHGMNVDSFSYSATQTGFAKSDLQPFLKDFNQWILCTYLSYADRIKVHVFDRGNMPLALIPHSDFWNSTAPQMLASFVDSQLGAGTATAGGTPLVPGRPIADPGPDRMVRTGANAVLTGENSLFASAFSWTHVSGPSNPVITNANGMVAIFNANVAGTYVENLSVNGGASSKNVTITVDDNFPDPLNIKFAQVKNVLQNVVHTGTTQQCISCHTPTANVAVAARVPPIWYTNFDRDLSGGAVDKTDDDWFLKALAGRVNLTEIGASPLLRKPTGNHHNGLKVIDVADTSTGAAGGLRSYSIFYNWILAGMQPGGDAANPVVNAANILTFSGSPLYSTGIALDGATSIGATNYLWTVLPGAPVGPTGAPAVISNPTSPSAVLNVPNVGDYVVQLHVDDGISSDAVLQTINVSEPTIVANFNPQTGSVLPTSPALGRGNITLSSTRTYGASVPVNCRWQILSGPAGALLDGSAVLDATKSCGTDAILNVPTSPAGGVYQVQLTASTLGLSLPVTHSLTVSSSAPTANLNNTTTPQAVTFTSDGTNTIIPTNTSLTGGGTAGTFSFQNVTANVSLSGSASTTPTGTLTYTWCLSSQPDSTRFPASIPICPTTTAPSLSATTTMTVRASGTYGVQLTVDNGSSPATASKTVSVTVVGGTSFQTIVNTVTGGTFTCSGCHVYGSPSVVNTSTQSGSAPPWDNATLTDGTTLYQRIQQRTSITSAASSLLLACPHSGCGGMPAQAAFSSQLSGSIYDQFLQWISHGAPPGN